MMNFFKNLFVKKEEEVRLKELEDWIDINLKPKTEEISKDIERIKALKEELKINLKELEKVEIKQETQKKIKDVILGNVPAYVRAVKIFLEKIIIPEKINFENTKMLYETVQKELDNLGQRTARNFAIMQTLIGKELAVTARNIKEIDETSKSIMKKSENLEKSEKIMRELEDIKEAEKNRIAYEKLRESYEKEKDKLGKEKSETEEKLERIGESKEAKELTELKRKIEEIETKKKERCNEILSLFSPLQKAFKRYNNMFYIKKVEEYINNAAETLNQDEDLEITKYLQDIKNMVQENKIDLKDDKKKKAIEAIEALNEAYLKNFKVEYQKLNKERTDVEKRIQENRYEIEKTELKEIIREKEKEIESIEKEIGKIKQTNIKEKIKEIENNLKWLGYEVKINALD